MRISTETSRVQGKHLWRGKMTSNALVESPSEPTPQPWRMKELSEKHKTVAALLAQGLGRQEVAAAAGFTPEYISMLQNQPLFADYVREMTAAAATQLEALFCKSTDVIAEAMVAGNIDERLKAAKLQMEATGRIGRNAEQERPQQGDRLDVLADRLLALLQTQRKRVFDGQVQDVEIVQNT